MTVDGSRTRAPSRDEKDFPTLINELTGLVIAYFKQETFGPIKSIGKYIAYGVAATVLFAVGGTLLAIGALRAVQTETGVHLHGDLSWVPYVAGILLVAGGLTWGVRQLGRGHG